MKKLTALIVAAITIAIAACAPPKPPPPVRIAGADTLPIPLSEMGARTYKSLEGGLYPGRSNAEPDDHAANGIAHRNAVRPLDVTGRPAVSGRYVLMSVGASDASAGWCSAWSGPPCNSWSLTGRAVADPLVNHTALVIVNGAFPAAGAGMWASAASSNYNRIRDTRLAPLGLSEKQVQVIWMNLGDANAVLPVESSAGDAAGALRQMGEVIRSLKQRYPNLQLLFVSSPRYAGYYTNGEPSAYESAFVVKWTIQSQIDEMRGAAHDPNVASLSPLNGSAPWISWGPYLWARGAQPRADGMSWLRADFDASARQLSREGEAKLGAALFEFFRSSAFTRCWFLAGPGCA